VAAVREEGKARTPDLGGKSSTEEVTVAVLEKLADRDAVHFKNPHPSFPKSTLSLRNRRPIISETPSFPQGGLPGDGRGFFRAADSSDQIG
jgi:hypothetical protein